MNQPGLELSRILCVRLDNLGDVIMMTPAIRAIRESVPHAHLTLLTSSVGSAITPFIEFIDEQLTFDAPWVKTYGSTPLPQEVLRLVQTLKEKQFDAAILFTTYSQSALPMALVTYLSEIPLRLGYSHENPYHLLTHWLPDPEPQVVQRHEVERQLALVNTLGFSTANTKLQLNNYQHENKSLQGKLHLHKLNQKKPYLIIHPGVSEERRRYPQDKFVSVIELLNQHAEYQIMITGTSAEAKLTSQIISRLTSQVIDVTGLLTLGEFINLIESASLLISGNTGPVHIAAAVGTPVVDLYATTNRQHTPWMVEQRTLFFDVPCKQCERGICGIEHETLTSVEPSDVYEAARELLTAAHSHDRT